MVSCPPALGITIPVTRVSEGFVGFTNLTNPSDTLVTGIGRGGGVPAMIVGQKARSATVHHMWGSGQVGAHENLQQNKKNSKNNVIN